MARLFEALEMRNEDIESGDSFIFLINQLEKRVEGVVEGS